MKPNMYNRICFLIALLAFLAACKKHHSEDAATPSDPSNNTSTYLTQSFSANKEEVNFQDSTTNEFFRAEFHDSIHWRITITGETSFAVKTIEGKSAKIDSSNSIWTGSQDSLYYFVCGETCFVTVFNISNVQSPTVLGSDTISITNTCTGLAKPKPANLIDLCPYFSYDYGDDLYYTVGYDDENQLANDTFVDKQIEYEAPVEANPSFNCIFNIPLQYAKGGRSIRGANYFMVKGRDQTQICNAANYYIGRLATPYFSKKSIDHDNSKVLYNSQLSVLNSMWTASSDEVYFNVFVYGTGDGSNLNFIVKEDDNLDGMYSDFNDEKYSAQITLDFTGWKLISFKYSDFAFTYTMPLIGLSCNNLQLRPGNYSNRIKEPAHIVLVEWSLIAHDLEGKGQFVLDYPSITIGSPLRY